MRFSIYTLSDSINEIPFYVGVTCQSLSTRFSCHTNACKRNNKERMYQYISDFDIKPKIELLEEIEASSLFEAEKIEMFWIEQMRQWGFLLYNIKGLINSRIKLKDKNSMANADDTKSIKISMATYNALAALAEKKNYKIGGYADTAILKSVNAELKNDKRKKTK